MTFEGWVGAGRQTTEIEINNSNNSQFLKSMAREASESESPGACVKNKDPQPQPGFMESKCLGMGPGNLMFYQNPR